jgi:hypothetical protein
MRQAKPEKKSRSDRDENASASFKRLGGRNLKDAETESDEQGEQENAAENEDSEEQGPTAGERADAGMKIAGHVGKAASGGKLRKAFSLWRVSKQLPVAAAGAGDLVKRYPGVTAALGGLAAAAAIYLLASRAAADEDHADEVGEHEGGQDDREQEQDAHSRRGRMRSSQSGTRA